MTTIRERNVRQFNLRGATQRKVDLARKAIDSVCGKISSGKAEAEAKVISASDELASPDILVQEDVAGHRDEIARLRAAAETERKARLTVERQAIFYAGLIEQEKEKAMKQTRQRAKAQARARIEARHRSDAEAKAKSYAVDLQKTRRELKARMDEISQLHSTAEAERQAKLFAERQVNHYTKAVHAAAEKLKAFAKERHRFEAELIAVLGHPEKTVVCQCCGRDDIEDSKLVKIDSGQLLCPDCLGALKTAVRT